MFSCSLYLVCLIIYRLYLSPIANYPGPKLTAVTGWYESYYELVKDGGGQFVFQIKKWHEKYGRPDFPISSPSIDVAFKIYPRRPYNPHQPP